MVTVAPHRRAGPSGEDQEDLGSGLPGGEAMLELLTRLQKFQSSLNAQLEVRPHLLYSH